MDPEIFNNGAPRFSPVSFNDHAGQLWILTILALIYSGMVAMARVYIKYQMYGFDDILIAFGTFLHLGQSIAVFVGLNNGIGKFNSITEEEQWSSSSRAFFAAEVICILGLSFAKCSLLALILRIIGTKTGKSRSACLALMGVSVVWGLASCLALAINCRADTLLTLQNPVQCPNQHARWVGVTVIDILTEVAAWILVVWITSTVNMSFERKCQVVLAFSFRLPLVILSALHLSYFANYPASAEPQFAITNALLLQQVMIAWSIISATIPNLKNFMKSFSIGMGFPIAFDISMYGSSNTYALQSLGNSKSKTTSSAAAAALASSSISVRDPTDEQCRDRPSTWRPDTIGHQSSVVHPFHAASNTPDDEDKLSRTGSQELIINKEVAWKVTYEGNR